MVTKCRWYMRISVLVKLISPHTTLKTGRPWSPNQTKLATKHVLARPKIDCNQHETVFHKACSCQTFLSEGPTVVRNLTVRRLFGQSSQQINLKQLRIDSMATTFRNSWGRTDVVSKGLRYAFKNCDYYCWKYNVFSKRLALYLMLRNIFSLMRNLASSIRVLCKIGTVSGWYEAILNCHDNFWRNSISWQ